MRFSEKHTLLTTFTFSSILLWEETIKYLPSALDHTELTVVALSLCLLSAAPTASCSLLNWLEQSTEPHQ